MSDIEAAENIENIDNNIIAADGNYMVPSQTLYLHSKTVRVESFFHKPNKWRLCKSNGIHKNS